MHAFALWIPVPCIGVVVLTGPHQVVGSGCLYLPETVSGNFDDGGRAHIPDQPAQILQDTRLAATRAGHAAPTMSEAKTLPSHDSLGPNYRDGGPDRGKESSKQDEDQTFLLVSRCFFGSRHCRTFSWQGVRRSRLAAQPAS